LPASAGRPSASSTTCAARQAPRPARPPGGAAHGEVTTGTVKLAGLAATGVGAALLEGGAPADVAVNAGLIAGGANLVNLFDLRPGRAIKSRLSPPG